MASDRDSSFAKALSAAGSPFTPGFGVLPAVLSGRDTLLEVVTAGLCSAIGTKPTYPVLIGERGHGKTVLLQRLVEEAEKAEWSVVFVSGNEGDPVVEIDRALSRARRTRRSTRVTGVEAKVLGSGGSVAFAGSDDPQTAATQYGDDFKQRLRDVADRHSPDKRLLLVLDEAHAVPLPQMRRLGAIMQQVASMERRPVCLLSAALPAAIETIYNDRKSTFLRRSARHEVPRIGDADMAYCFAETVDHGGGTITAEAVDRAVQGAGGHPYMAQMVGHRMWMLSRSADSHSINVGHAEQAVTDMVPDLLDDIYVPIWDDLTDRDRALLACIATDSQDTVHTATAAAMAGIPANQAGRYRERIIRTGFVKTSKRGHVQFADMQAQQWIAGMVAAGETTIPLPLPPDS